MKTEDVEKLTTKWQQELTAIRDDALRNKQVCVELATSCDGLAKAARVVMKQIDNEFRALRKRARAEKQARKGTPATRTAQGKKKATA